MSRLLFALYAVVPPFALFGPMFIVQSIPGLPLWSRLYASVGALMIGLSVVAVMLRQRKIEARLDALDRGEAGTATASGKGAKSWGAV